MKIIDYYELDLPTWAICYLVNGDASGLTDEDQQTVDEWAQEMQERCARKFPGLSSDLIIRDDDEGGFKRYPEFGLATDCVDAVWAIWADNEDPRQAFPLPWEETEEETEEE